MLPARHTKPQCPVCHVRISFLQSARMWNPWRVRCPNCRAALQVSRLVKALAIAGIPLGILYAAVPIYMEESGRWLTIQSLVYFAVTAPLLLGLDYAFWTSIEFRAKDEGT